MDALKKNFLKLDKVLAIGDSLFDDVYGGKRNKMRTTVVRNVEIKGRQIIKKYIKTL